ncbi:MAG: tetratricopeptide repeat protein [Kiritimatiellia bacterium]
MKPSFPSLDLPPGLAFAARVIRRLAIALSILAVALVLLELAASRIAPVRPTRFLVEGESNGQPAWIDNQFFPYRFFSIRTAKAPPPIVALKTPAEDALRVCLLGGSSALGDPDPSFGAGRQLEIMLERRYPGHPVEVVRMAFEGGNSHALREAARELQRLAPHAVVVLTGNEEIAGPYGPASSLGRFCFGPRTARWMTLFSRTRISQLCIAAVRRLAPARDDLNAWRSQEPISLRGRMAPDDPRLKTAYRSFRHNLDAILAAAAQTSPAVVVCTVPVNQRDCAPFSTSFLDDETAAQEVRELLREAVAAETASNRTEAARLYADSIRRHPTHAEALFRAARLELQDGRDAEAAALFSRARDADALRLRADSTINAIIRECAADASASLLDAEALFAGQSPHGIPGREWFLDHVHFTFGGNHLLAQSILRRLEELRAFDPEPTGTLPPPEEMASELLYHPWGSADVLAALIARQIHPPFRRQLTNPATVARLAEEKQIWDARVAASSRENTRATFAQRRKDRPADAWLAARVAWYLLLAGDPAGAETAAWAAHECWPHRFDVRALLALTRARQGQRAQDGIALLRAPGEDCGYYDVEWTLAIGQQFIESRNYADAAPWLEYALERDPWNSGAHIAMAKALFHLDQSDQAFELLETAIERNPRNPLLREEIASLYCLRGWPAQPPDRPKSDWDVATRYYEESGRIAPYRYERFLKWADALVRLKQYARAQRPLELYLAAMPNDPDALALQAEIQSHAAPPPEPADPPAAKDESKKFPWE